MFPETLAESVKNLPEIYQPIYGHPEFDSAAARTTKDRAQIIGDFYLKASKKLNRPLRVLDLGCSQGYFAFSLANLGAEVTGVDYEAANVNVCEIIAGGIETIKPSFFKQTYRISYQTSRAVSMTSYSHFLFFTTWFIETD